MNFVVQQNIKIDIHCMILDIERYRSNYNFSLLYLIKFTFLSEKSKSPLFLIGSVPQSKELQTVFINTCKVKVAVKHSTF